MKASSTVAIAFVKSLLIPLHLLQDGTDTIICSRLNDDTVATEHYSLTGHDNPVQTKPVRKICAFRPGFKIYMYGQVSNETERGHMCVHVFLFLFLFFESFTLYLKWKERRKAHLASSIPTLFYVKSVFRPSLVLKPFYLLQFVRKLCN